MKIKFFKPYITGKELPYITDIIANRRDMSGDGVYTKKVHAFLQKRYKTQKVLLTTSGTAALELAVRLCNLKKGDEIITPSFTFSSTVNAILLSAGVQAVFADIDPRTQNIDPADIERKITKKTKALMIVHYAGIACDMDRIMQIAKKHNLKVVEDAAQAIESTYRGKQLGTFGDFGCFSFHDTKNIICGEGGALFINTKDHEVNELAEIVREKGTNRSMFFRGQVDKYTWVETGSSYLPSDILAAYLLAQLEEIEKITRLRLNVYTYFTENLSAYQKMGLIRLPYIPKNVRHNAHIFYVLFVNESERNFVMDFMKQNGVAATFHYIPLHSAPRGKRLGYKASDLPVTETNAYRLLRLPIYSGMTAPERRMVVRVFDEAMVALVKERQQAKRLSEQAKNRQLFGAFRQYVRHAFNPISLLRSSI